LPRRTDAAILLKISQPETPAQAVRTRNHQRLLSTLILAGAAVVPLAVSMQGLDTFRLPKQLAMYATAILAAAGGAISLLRAPKIQLGWRMLPAPFWWAAAGVAWTLVALFFSSNRPLSVDALIFTLAVISIGVVAAFSLAHTPPALLAAAVLIPALINAGFLFLQAFQIWSPWVVPSGAPLRAHNIALLGDTNTLGAYFVGPIIFATVLSLSSRQLMWRLSYGGSACILGAGLVLTESRTPIISTVLALAALAILHLRVRAIPLLFVIILGAAAVATLYTPLKQRVAAVIEAVSLGNLDAATGGRVPAFIAAWEMFMDHPVTGVGPGVFKFEYMPYRVAISGEYPSVPGLARPNGVNFGEVHNDHLQLLAEVGIPGYLMLLGVLASVARISFSKPILDDESGRAARLLALPLTVALFFTMLGNFPLQRAASVCTFALIGAVCIAWATVRHVD
jgi:O-antigen ligase